MKYSICIFFSIGFLIFSSTIFGQQEIKFKHITVDEGLSQNWARCIFQDSYGYLWVGSGGNGINKFDGYEFKLYQSDAKDNNSLTNNWICSVFEDKQHRLWVGTSHGLNLYDRKNDKFIRFSFFQNDYIAGINESDDGKLFVVTILNIYEVNVEKNTAVPFCKNTDNGCNPNIFTSPIVKDYKGNYWVSSSNGLFSVNIETETLTAFNHNKKDPKSISENLLERLYCDSKGRVWIGTKNKGLSLIMYENDNPSKPYFVNITHDPNNTNSINPGTVRAILDDGNGQLWVGTENGGLNILDLKNFDQGKTIFRHFLNNINDKFSLSNNSIYSIYKDIQGIIWVGTYSGGINYFSPLFYKFEHYTQIPNTNNSLINNTVNVFLEEGKNIWIGTEGGLNILNRETGLYTDFSNKKNTPNSLGSNAVWSLFKDSRNNIWVGTWDGGLNLFNRKSNTFTHFLHDPDNPKSISSNNIFGTTEDENGYLWIATMGGGLNRYDYRNNEFKTYLADFSVNNSLSGDWVQTLIETKNNELWVSTSDGLDLYNKKTGEFINFKHDTANPRSISYNGANAIFEDSRNNIWLGTDGGLNFFVRKDSSFIYYNEEDGLPNNAIKAICEDDKGNLWISTNFGISKFINGIEHPKNPVFKNYNKSDGLQGNEFCRRSALKTSDGKLFFGGINGYNAFYPDSVKENPYIPTVILTDFLIFNHPAEINTNNSPLKEHISLTKTLVLNSDISVFSFKYAALNFILPEKNQYAYIMIGFETKWNYVGNKREATYTNLAPGKYTFIVKASNNDGHWNETGTSIQITILPPWWKTIWFRVLAIFILISAFTGFFLVRVNVLKKQKLMLENVVQLRTKEVKEKNNILIKQTAELYEVNTMLEERNQYIEEQNNLLIDKTEKLNESNSLLSQQKHRLKELNEELQTQTDNLLEKNVLLQERQQQIEKQSDELKRTNDQLKTLNGTKDKFFSILAHDLKNPFNNILGFCELLLSNYDRYNDSKKIGFVRTIYDSSKNIFKLLENLLQWARSQTGKLEFNPEKIVLYELISLNRELARNLLLEKDISLNSNITEDIIVFADNNMVNTVIRNLIANAIKFTDQGEINIFAIDEHPFIRVIIKDYGVGMSKQKLETIFDIGTTKSTKGTRGETGTGLGLILCKEFIEKNGGTISVVSEENEGTSFSFTIPKFIE